MSVPYWVASLRDRRTGDLIDSIRLPLPADKAEAAREAREEFRARHPHANFDEVCVHVERIWGWHAP